MNFIMDAGILVAMQFIIFEVWMIRFDNFSYSINRILIDIAYISCIDPHLNITYYIKYIISYLSINDLLNVCSKSLSINELILVNSMLIIVTIFKKVHRVTKAWFWFQSVFIITFPQFHCVKPKFDLLFAKSECFCNKIPCVLKIFTTSKQQYNECS